MENTGEKMFFPRLLMIRRRAAAHRHVASLTMHRP